MKVLIFLFFFFQAALARLEALENDNAGIETVEANDEDEDSLDDDDQGFFFFLTLFHFGDFVLLNCC